MAENGKLAALAELFKPYAALYAVGGCVRNGILGIESGDIDICSELDVNTVKNILLNTDYVVLDKNLRVGTVIIKSGDFTAEYTAFREDSYPSGSGKHAPDKVKFTSDIAIDAKRRDFKMNAVYYDILKKSPVDPLGGIEDIKKRIISAAALPREVFGADGLRILRLVRFASELGFCVDPETFSAAKENAGKVRDIVPERILPELDKIFTADCAYPNLSAADGHFKGLSLLDELGLTEILLPELAALKGMEQPKKYHVYDAYRHSTEAFRAARPRVRWAALYHDVGKEEAVRTTGKMHGHDILSARLAEERFRALKFPKARAAHAVELIKYHMVDIDGNTHESKLRWFIAEHSDVISDLLDVMDADAYATLGKDAGKLRLRKIYESMIAEGVPLSVKRLKINGADLIKLGVPEKQRAEVMRKLHRETVLNMQLNDRDKALTFIAKELKNNGNG